MKTIAFPVGVAGRNLADDVRTIQYLLNCVPKGGGGPSVPLALDGDIENGVNALLTRTAIGALQKRWFGWSDIRIEPDSPMLRRLQAYDPFPGVSIDQLRIEGRQPAAAAMPLPHEAAPKGKRISSSVGAGGFNLAPDVRTVKYLLNNVPPEEGGSNVPLIETDTIMQVSDRVTLFQKHQFGVADGLVDPDGYTMRLLRFFDPFPGGPAQIPATRAAAHPLLP